MEKGKLFNIAESKRASVRADVHAAVQSDGRVLLKLPVSRFLAYRVIGVIVELDVPGTTADRLRECLSHVLRKTAGTPIASTVKMASVESELLSKVSRYFREHPERLPTDCIRCGMPITGETGMLWGSLNRVICRDLVGCQMRQRAIQATVGPLLKRKHHRTQSKPKTRRGAAAR